MNDNDVQVAPEWVAEIRSCYEANSPWVRGYARVLTRDGRRPDGSVTAEDLLQDTFVAAARAWVTMRHLTDVKQRAWLRTTLFRIAGRSSLRSQRLRDLLPDIYERYASVPSDPEGSATTGIVVEKIMEVIEGLPPQQRLIAMMRWIDQMKNTEIAAELGTTPNVVAVQVNAIRRKFTSSLGPEHPGTGEVVKGGKG
jgi:RNA polymerase sigma factor (sigma-70 family)